MPSVRSHLGIRVAGLVVVLAGIACGADGGVTPLPSSTTRPGGPTIGECERAAISPEKVAIVPHGERLEAVMEPIRDALKKAIDHAASAYGWTPADAICVHVFPGDSGFVGGLKRFGGFDEATAKSYQTFFGTIGRDIASGREAIFLNAAFPARMPFLVTHEYFHIVQPHVGGTGFPTWFLEGLADWEALKLEEPPFQNWLSVLMSEQRAGGGRPPSARSRRGTSGARPWTPAILPFPPPATTRRGLPWCSSRRSQARKPRAISCGVPPAVTRFSSRRSFAKSRVSACQSSKRAWTPSWQNRRALNEEQCASFP